MPFEETIWSGPGLLAGHDEFVAGRRSAPPPGGGATATAAGVHRGEEREVDRAEPARGGDAGAGGEVAAGGADVGVAVAAVARG